MASSPPPDPLYPFAWADTPGTQDSYSPLNGIAASPDDDDPLQLHRDEARVRQADADLVSGWKAVSAPWFAARGETAARRWQEIRQALDETLSRPLASLENDRQRRLYGEIAALRHGAWQNEASAHATREAQAFNEAESQRRQDLAQGAIVRGARLGDARAVAEGEQRLIGEIRGRSRRLGLDADAAGTAEAEALNKARADAADHLVAHDPQRARSWVDWHRGLFDPATTERLDGWLRPYAAEQDAGPLALSGQPDAADAAAPDAETQAVIDRSWAKVLDPNAVSLRVIPPADHARLPAEHQAGIGAAIAANRRGRDPDPDPALFRSLADKARQGRLEVADVRQAWGKLPLRDWQQVDGWQRGKPDPWAKPEISTDGKGVAYFGDEQTPFQGLRPDIEQGYLSIWTDMTSTPEDLLAYAKANGFEISEDETRKRYAQRDKAGEAASQIEYLNRPRTLTDPGDGALGAAARGLADPFNFLDEIGGIVDSLGGTKGRENIWNSDRRFGDILWGNSEKNRAILGFDEAHHPWARFGGQIAGSLLIPGAELETIGLRAATSTMRTTGSRYLAKQAAREAIGRYVLGTAIAEGALSGLGAGEGNLRERYPSMVMGAAGGALGGTAAGALGPLVGPGVARIRGMLRDGNSASDAAATAISPETTPLATAARPAERVAITDGTALDVTEAPSAPPVHFPPQGATASSLPPASSITRATDDVGSGGQAIIPTDGRNEAIRRALKSSGSGLAETPAVRHGAVKQALPIENGVLKAIQQGKNLSSNAGNADTTLPLNGKSLPLGAPGGEDVTFGKSVNDAEAYPLRNHESIPPERSKESDDIRVTNPGPPAHPKAYSVLFEMVLDPVDFGKYRGLHFRRANAALKAWLASDPEMTKFFDEAFPDFRDAVSAVRRRSAPEGWRWEHASTSTTNGRVGVMRLVPREQHTPGSVWWRTIHPDPGARGGYSEWAIPAGARKNRVRRRKKP
ncbi:hypothetical protein [Flavisphingomonas formosensis]|uniref:hypothetical protein n=1 Tax=Flavisphingomonas formosensis TaxID=861534 RepID=UPI0012F969D9|nr:hypothetical protein [Sphingomonas formosensis]